MFHLTVLSTVALVENGVYQWCLNLFSNIKWIISWLKSVKKTTRNFLNSVTKITEKLKTVFFLSLPAFGKLHDIK